MTDYPFPGEWAARLMLSRMSQRERTDVTLATMHPYNLWAYWHANKAIGVEPLSQHDSNVRHCYNDAVDFGIVFG